MGGIIQKIDSGEMNAWYSCIFIRQGLCSPGLGFSYSLTKHVWAGLRICQMENASSLSDGELIVRSRDPDARISLKAPNEER